MEDNEQVRRFISMALIHHGYNVTIASNKQEAQEIFKKDRYHMLLTDMVLPDGKGLDLARDLRKQESRLAVLIASGYAGEKSGYNDIKESGFMFIQKPFEIMDLLQSVKRALEEVHETVSMP